MKPTYRIWRYRGIPIPIRVWTWKHTLCVRLLLWWGWPPWKAYSVTQRWLG